MLHQNKYLAILLSMTAYSCMTAAEFTITKPYQPSFLARHATAYKAALTSTFTLGAGYLLANRIEPGPAGAIGLAAGFAFYIHQMTKKQRLLDSVLLNPAATLKELNTIKDRCGEEHKRMEADTKASKSSSSAITKTLIDKFTLQNPVFLLNECVAQHCSLSRYYRPQFRQQFESRVGTLIKDKLQDLTRSVQYVSFGCGDMFQDYVNLTKILAQKPDAQLSIHLIDINHGPYITCRKLIENTRVVASGTRINSLDALANSVAMKTFKKIAQEELSLDIEKLDDTQLVDAIVEEYENREAPARQCIAWLSKTFPTSKLKLYMHDTVDSYYRYINTEKIESPDVIVSADIDDDRSFSHSSVPSYKKLCIQALQKKPGLRNIWLRERNDSNDSIDVSLAEITLQETQGAVKLEVQLEEGTTVPAYVKVQKLT